MGVEDLRVALQELETRIIGRRLELYEAIDSTNSYLAQQARGGEPEGLAVLADQQLAGKGRRGRSWASPPESSILCSILLRPRTLHPSQAFALTMFAAVSAAAAIEETAAIPIELKWPNDLQCGGRKLGGILVEIEGRSDEIAWAVIGCGINISWDPALLPELRQRATSVQRERGAPIERGPIARALLQQFDRRYPPLLHGEIEPLLAEWRGRLATLGRPVEVETTGSRFSGWAVDVDAEGALLVRDDYGYIHRLLSGDVSIRGTG